MTRLIGISPNMSAFLDMIALSEIGALLLSESDDGYNILVGATPSNMLTFSNYSTHPNILNKSLNSTAAGRYQIIHPTWFSLCKQKGYTDFSPETQDAMAMDLIAQKGGTPFIEQGAIVGALRACSPIWASLPFSGAGQPTNSIGELISAFANFGGTISA